MDGPPVCEKCGLKAVRHELERKGIIIRFCDDCYWGEVEKVQEGGVRELPSTSAAPPERAN